MSGADELARALFDAVNAVDQAALERLCDERVELLLLPGEAGGRRESYVGHAGLREFLLDAVSAWEQLLLTPGEVQARGEVVLVGGRVHARSREHGLRDLPVVWLVRSRKGRIASARVFPDLDAAIDAAAAEGAANGASD